MASLEILTSFPVFLLHFSTNGFSYLVTQHQEPGTLPEAPITGHQLKMCRDGVTSINSCCSLHLVQELQLGRVLNGGEQLLRARAGCALRVLVPAPEDEQRHRKTTVTV